MRRSVARLRHGALLLGQLTAYAVVNRVVWLLPLVLLLLLVAVLVVTSQVVAPLIYTIF